MIDWYFVADVTLGKRIFQIPYTNLEIQMGQQAVSFGSTTSQIQEHIIENRFR